MRIKTIAALAPGQLVRHIGSGNTYRVKSVDYNRFADYYYARVVREHTIMNPDEWEIVNLNPGEREIVNKEASENHE